MREMLPEWIPQLEVHEDLACGEYEYTPEVHAELQRTSAAMIDRKLCEQRWALELKGILATRSGALLQNSITIRRAGDEAVDERDVLALLRQSVIWQMNFFTATKKPVEVTCDIVRYKGTLVTKAGWKTEVLTAEVEDANKKRRARHTGGVKIRAA